MNIEEVWLDTQKLCANIKIPPYKVSHCDFKYSPPKKFERCEISVVLKDILDATLLEEEAVMLNMACTERMGNDPRLFGAQEEDLFRRTSISKHLNSRLYPIPNDVCILTTGVQVFKSKYMDGYSRLLDTKTVDVISCSAININRNPWNASVMFCKIWTIFQTASIQGYKVLVLSAFGCGGYGCDPDKVARIFKMVIDCFKYTFEKIIFAITDVEQHPHSNFPTFKRILVS